jgi:hypothetical protein
MSPPFLLHALLVAMAMTSTSRPIPPYAAWRGRQLFRAQNREACSPYHAKPTIADTSALLAEVHASAPENRLGNAPSGARCWANERKTLWMMVMI